MDCNLPGSSVHRISQARVLEGVAIFFSRGSPQPRNRTQLSCISRWIITEPPGKPRPSHSILNISGARERSYFWSWRENSLSPLSMFVTCGLFIKAVYSLRKFPSIPNLLSAFVMKGCSIFSTAFPHLFRWARIFVLYSIKYDALGNSLAVLWLGLWAFIFERLGSIPDWQNQDPASFMVQSKKSVLVFIVFS